MTLRANGAAHGDGRLQPLIRRLMLAAAVVSVPTLAHAHAHLRSSDPAAGSTIKTAPSQVEITFSEAVEPRFSSIAVTDGAGKTMDQGSVHIEGDDAHRLVVGVRTLSPGTYRVEWHATSVDTHKTEGRFDFTVAP